MAENGVYNLTNRSSAMSTDTSNGDYPRGQRNAIEEQLAGFRDADSARERLILSLLSRLTQANQDKQRLEDDYSNEALSRRNWQTQANEYKREIDAARHKAESDPFALALIDGDGCIFQDALLRKAGDGGAEAAHLLYTAIRDTLGERGSNLGTIMVNIYADLDSLSRKLATVGLINTPADLQAFTRAFSMSKPLFNFVDVGKGKERADHKLKEMFRLFVHNSHCKHIFFAGCHDNGYLLDLVPHKHDTGVASRMTLLESTDAEYQYRDLGFPIVRYESVFRSQQLPDNRHLQSYQHGQYAQPTLSGAANVFSPTFQGSENIFSSSYSSPMPAPAGLAVKSPSPVQNGQNIRPPAHTQQQSSSDTSKTAASAAASTWATVGGANPAKKISIAPAKEAKPLRYCIFNAEDQRIDDPLPRLDKEAEANVSTRIAKNGKLCNNFHLRGFCGNGSGCQFSHEPALRESEKNVLRHRARTTVCKKLFDCDDVTCILGHQCPHKYCTRGRECHFRDTHDMDLTPHLKIYEDNSVVTYGQPLD